MIYNTQTMIRYKIIWLYLLCFVHNATLQEAEDRITNVLKPPDKLILQKSKPYPERKNEPSFMSKLASWISPFGESETTHDSVPAAGHYGAPQYLPPPQYSPPPSYSHSHIGRDCNPCNEEPWIPIAPSFSQHSILRFAPPKVHFNQFSSHGADLTGLETLHPPPASYKTPENLYNAPPQFRPKNNYGLPQQQIHGPPHNKPDLVILDYMMPPPVNYKIPSLIYGPPKESYTPPRPAYGPPTKPIYGPPPKPVYGPPTKPIYGPPPKAIYGPPPQNLPDQYRPPFLSVQPPPTLEIQYGSPQNHPSTYLRPVAEGYSPLSPDIKPPTINNNYGPPQLSHGPTNPTTFFDENTVRNIQPAVPSDSYGAPVTGDNLDYSLPAEQLSQPSGYNANLERPISLPNLSSAPVAPIHDYEDFNQGFNTHEQSLKQGNQEDSVQIQKSVNIADYLASIEHPIDVIQSPIIEVSVKDDVQDDVPSNQHNFQEFAGNYGPTEQKSFKNDNNINIDTNENSGNSDEPENFNSDLIQSQIYSQQNGFNQVEEKTYNSINEKLHDSGVNANNYESSSLKLSENPIIVEDVHTAASNINNTFVNSKERQVKRTNDNDLAIQTLINEKIHSQLHPQNSSFSTNAIKKLLLDQERLQNLRKVANVNGVKTALNNRTGFTTPIVEYGNWAPTYTSTVPGTHIRHVNYPTTTDKPKQLQIIIPYVTNKKPGWFEKDRSSPKNSKRAHVPKVNVNSDAYTTLLPVYTPPVSTEVSLWSKFMDFNFAESKRVTATAFSKSTTDVYNIKDLLQNKNSNHRSEKLPFDIVSLQKNIDDWTQQSYSIKTDADYHPKSTERILTSKKIPDDYFTTVTPKETTTIKNYIFDYESNGSTMKDPKTVPNYYLTTSPNDITTVKNYIFNYQSDGSTKKENIAKVETDDIETNLIISGETTNQEPTTTPITVTSTKSSSPSPFSSKDQRSLWDVSHVTLSPHTKEKVYVVTPQTYSFYTSTPATAWSMAPKIQNGIVNNASTYDTHKFSIRVEPENKGSRDKLKKDLKSSVKVVFSEWPHLINNLQTTTIKPTSRHPLFGLMDILAYTPAPNATVETIVGHSRVVTVVTPSSVARKRTTGNIEKIQVTTSKSF